jgi:hypothetical protein
MDNKLKNEIIKKMMAYFAYNNNLINHAYRVLHYAEEISGVENGVPDVVISSAILHDIGIPSCEKKYKSNEGQLQEIEGPPLAREILGSLGMDELIIKEVCEIIGCHHSPGEIDTVNFKIMWDADMLVNLPDIYDVKDRVNLQGIISENFMTKAGLKIAKELYL